MLTAIAIEIRDNGTFILAVAVALSREDGALIRRAGYGERQILLARADGGRKAEWDPFAWGDRTWTVAHLWIAEHWSELLAASAEGASHHVVDVRYILGETSAPAPSEARF